MTQSCVIPGQRDAGESKQSKCIAEEKVLRDGTVVIHKSDCTTQAKSRFAAGQAESSSAEEKTPSLPAKGVDPLMPRAPDLPDEATKQKYAEAVANYYSYHAHGFIYRQRVFDWQLLSSKIIFVVVILLVCVGIYFAALQFHYGLRRPAVVTQESKTSAGSRQLIQPEVTTVAASLKGIQVSSPVLGVIVLTISLAFLYLYLVYVYPVTEIF